VKKQIRYPRESEVQILRKVELYATAAPPAITKAFHDFVTSGYASTDLISNTARETYLFTLTNERNGTPVTIRVDGIEVSAVDIPLRVTTVTTWAELFFVGPPKPCVCKAKLVFTKPDYEDHFTEEWTIVFT
jgi:hypothetical protein